ncbi:MAG: T9SS type A sorting domain-containing protein [candidate division WOR-3 bacterium]|nr:MAG: T9SS type A sorting domain-containing protein [candidate division WOR-3 bacterium]
MTALIVIILAIVPARVEIPAYGIHYENTMGFDQIDHFYSERDDCVYLTSNGAIIAAFPAHQNPAVLQRDTIGTIWYPDELSGVAYPEEFVANPVNQTVYIIGSYGRNIAACDIQTGERTDGIMTGRGTMALAYSVTQNKLYCPAYYDFTVDVVDCATNDVIKTISLAGALTDACWNSTNDRVYCSNYSMGSVDVIDCASDSFVRRITVGTNPRAVLYNPISDKVYCALANNVAIIDCGVDSVITTVAVGSPNYFFALNTVNNKVYCVNRGSSTVSIIDGVSNTLITTLAVSSWPECISYNPVMNRIYVGHSSGQNVVVIDGSTNSVTGTISLGQPIYASTCDTTDNRLFVTSSSDQAIVIDCTNNTIISYLAAANWPMGVFWESGYNNVWIGNTGASNLPGFTVQGYEADDLTVLFKTVIGYTPYSTMLDPGTNKFYAAGRGDEILAILDMTSPDTSVMLYVRNGPWDVCDNPNENKVYCASRYDNRVSIIDATTNSILGEVTTGQFPVGVVCNSTDNKIYSVNFWGDNVTVIDGSTNNFLGHIQVGSGPYDILYNPDGNKIYSIDYGNNTVTVIDANADTVITTLSVGNWPWSAVHNAIDNKIYIANYASHNISVIDGATNGLISTLFIAPDAYPFTLVYNPQNNKVYSANIFSSTMTIIDASVDTIITTFGLNGTPYSLAYNPNSNVIYCAYVCTWQDALVVIDGNTNAVLANFVIPSQINSYGIDSPREALVYDAEQDILYMSHYTSSKITMVDGGTGISEHSSMVPENSLLSILPNPAKERANIRFQIDYAGYTTGELRLGIYDIAGRLVKEERFEYSGAEHSTSLRGVSPGVYFVVLESEAGRITGKLVLLK